MQASSWTVYPHLPVEELKAFEHAGIDRYLAQILSNRGSRKVAQMRALIDACYEDTSDPLTLVDMPRAVERIQRALIQGEHITVYGDYDADGVTSSSLLFRALRVLKQPQARLDFHIP
ncbi:MAG: single-stranded-DNA-specific exonuclease RecJ, partial [Chloroflexi bacterium]|nr:single-stranded-DNA-specific exonuclease RecJ [Chloroflexota bacterium]